MTAPQPGLQIVEAHATIADPTALGVFGLSLVTFVAASQKMHWTDGVGYLIPWAMFLGSIAQVWASTLDFKKNNYFGAIVLGVYGLFWMAVAMHWAISLGWFGAIDPSKFDPRQIAFAFFAYGIFSLFIMVVAFETNKIFATILVLVNILLFSLGFASLGIAKAMLSTAAAWSELAISLLGFYACGAIFFKNFFGREILPLGAPLGLIKRS